MTSIYAKTLHDLRGLILVWGLGLAGVASLNVVFFPTFQALPEMMSFLKNLPPVFKSFLGDIEAVMTLEGFLKLKVFDALPLLLGVFGLTQGARALTGELEHKTCDLLLAQPVPRRCVVTQKFLALVSASILIAALAAAGLQLSCLIVGADVHTAFLWLGAANGLPLAWVFAALALFGSATLKSSRRAAVLAGSFMATAYVFETLRLVSPKLVGWRWISPFAHHRDGLSFGGSLAIEPMLVFVGIAFVLVGAAAWRFTKRDLRG